MTVSKDVSIGHVVSWVALIVTLISAGSAVYSDQKINTIKIQSQSEIIKSHAKAINSLTSNQAKMVATISNNKTSIKELKDELKDVKSIVRESREYLIRIAGKVGADDKKIK